MSWFSKGLKGLGHLAEKAAPIVGLIPGVGTIAGGAIGGLGALAAGDGLSGALKYGLEGAASGYGGGLLRGGKAGTSIASILGGGGLGEGAAGTGIGGIADAGASSGGGLSGLLGTAGKFLMGNGGQNALGVAQGINGILDQKKSENYGKDALGAATGAYNAAAPLRAQGIQGLLNPQSPDLSNIRAIQGQLAYKPPTPTPITQFAAPQHPQRVSQFMQDAGNPYARTA